MGQFQFDPDAYSDPIAAELPDDARVQDGLTTATAGPAASHVLDLGTGTGVTATAVVLTRGPGARVVGVDESADVAAHARRVVAQADLGVSRLVGPVTDPHRP